MITQRYARHAMSNDQPELTEEQTMSLHSLDTADAPDFRRRDYVEATPLQTLHAEIRDHFRRLDATREEQKVDPILGGEDFSCCFKWYDEIQDAHSTDRQKIMLTTKLGDIRYRWIAVYPVTGSSEGHYIHVDLIHQTDREEFRTPLFLVKTFMGHAAAVAVAAELSRLLGV